MRHLRDIYATFNDAKARKEYMQKTMCTIHRRNDWNYVIEITLRTTVIFQIHKFHEKSFDICLNKHLLREMCKYLIQVGGRVNYQLSYAVGYNVLSIYLHPSRFY